MQKGFKSCLLVAKATFSLNLDGAFLDLLKAKITGGADFGIPNIEANADVGTGFSLELDAYSVSGIVVGSIVLVIEYILATIELYDALNKLIILTLHTKQNGNFNYFRNLNQLFRSA